MCHDVSENGTTTSHLYHLIYIPLSRLEYIMISMEVHGPIAPSHERWHLQEARLTVEGGAQGQG